MSIYLYDNPPSIRSKFLLTYMKDYEELWSTVPTGTERWKKLSELISSCADKAKNPVSLLDYYDCVGSPDMKNVSGHQIGCVCGGKNGAGTWTDYMEVLSDVIRKIEKEYGRIWVFNLKNHSDVHYVYFGFNDRSADFAKFWLSKSLGKGNDTKFLCDCGQFETTSAFKRQCPWAFDDNGKVKRGFFYNDSSKRGMCTDTVSLGNSVFFKSHGFVGNTYASDMNGKEYSWLAKSRNVNVKKCHDCGNADSIEEFIIRRTAEGGLKPGDWFTTSKRVTVNGEDRVEYIYPVWDGSKWIDKESERIITLI